LIENLKDRREGMEITHGCFGFVTVSIWQNISRLIVLYGDEAAI